MADEFTVYGLKNCDSCRRAMRLFKELNIPARLIDVRDHPPAQTRLKRWCGTLDRNRLLNKRSTTWRSLSASAKEVNSDAAAVKLLVAHPTLMKRPVIERGETLLLGCDRQQILNCSP